MECIKELKKIGIQEINAKTKIATKRLDDIFECRFDEIDRTRVKGFIYILQREYKVDMSEWLEKYDEYHREKENECMQNENLKDSKSDNVNISFVDTTIKDKTYTRLVSVFMLLFVLFIGYFIYNNLIKDTNNNHVNTINLDETNMINSNNVDSNFYDDTLISNNAIDATLEATQSNENNALLPQHNEVEDNNLQDNAVSSHSENSEQIDSNTQQYVVDNNTLISDLNNMTSIISIDEATITPKSPLWIGIIDLQTYRKKQISISDSFKIELDNSKIIRTGHGYFDIKSQNFNEQYIGGDSKYFIYTREDGLKEISKEEFLGFNRGKEW